MERFSEMCRSKEFVLVLEDKLQGYERSYGRNSAGKIKTSSRTASPAFLQARKPTKKK